MKSFMTHGFPIALAILLAGPYLPECAIVNASPACDELVHARHRPDSIAQ